jgi:hypothetical protein
MDNEEAGSAPNDPPAFERRRGPRRNYEHIDPETGERRTQDRRRTPGVDALLDRMLGVRETIPEPPPSDAAPESDSKQ